MILSYKGANSTTNYSPEFLFSFFLFLFSFAKPITQLTEHSGVLLLIFSLVCLVSLFFSKKGRKGDFYSLKIISLFIGVLLFIDCNFRYNSNSAIYIYNYILYAVLPGIFLSYVVFFRPILWYYSIFSILNGLIYIVDPIINPYSISGGYMPFGFNIMLPASVGASIQFFYFRNYKVIILLLLFLGSLLIFANKGAFLSAIISILYFYIYVYKKSGLRLIHVALIFFVFFLLIALAPLILSFAEDILHSLGLDYSYALDGFKNLIRGNTSDVTDARYQVWEEACNMIAQEPVFGWGVGWFSEFSYQPYPHNIYLEVIVEYGFLGAFIFSTFLIRALISQKREQCFCKKIFDNYMLILWVGPLLISNTFWMVMTFWIFWLNVNKRTVVYDE